MLAWLISILFLICGSVQCLKYEMEAGKNVSLDCTKVNGNISFYSSRDGKDWTRIEPKENSFELNEKVLTIVKLRKDDLNKVYKCNNSENTKITWSSHPQFGGDDAKYKSGINILSNKFRLLLEFETKNDTCKWRFTPLAGTASADNKTNDSEITITETNQKYIVGPNFLQVLKPQSQDSGTYFCELKNEYGHNFRKVDVKIKNELLALLPFLIVLAQVVLCSALFFIWEKRCSGRESSNEYSFEQV